MKMETALGNGQTPFKFTLDINERQTSVSETISDRYAEPIHDRQQRLGRWIEYFKEQFSWPRANMVTATSTIVNPWEAPLDLQK